MQHPISKAIRQALAQRFQSDFAVAAIIAIPLQAGECRETRADDIRMWCNGNCANRWKPVERWTEDAVRIGFECDLDAMLFRLSH